MSQDPFETIRDIMAMMTVVDQLDAEQKNISEALPAMHEKLEGEAKANYDALSERANNIVAQLSDLNIKLDAALTSHRADFAKLEKSIETRRKEVAEYSKRVETEVPKPVAEKIRALFEEIPKPKDGAPGPAGKDGVNTDLAASFRGNWNVNVLYKRGETFTFRGAFYLVLKDTKGLLPTVASQEAPLKNYAVVALSGAPGPAGANGTNGSGGTNFVSPPATSTSSGTAAQIAYDSSYFYVCIATNTWVRAALNDWS